jgi:3-carboxy-cis,cis-muconate cycloisomerase
MQLLDPLFGSEAVCGIFSEAASLQRMLDFEAALARAGASVGLITVAAAEAIGAQCRVENLDTKALAFAAADAGNLAIPLVKQLTRRVELVSPDAAAYVHWGATSQDVIDTALVLQMRDALAEIERSAVELCHQLSELVLNHRGTPMVARTWMQQAVPTTFGVKAAGWLDAMLRHRERLAELRTRLFVLQFGGAAGTLAALGKRAQGVAEALARELKLGLPEIPWHTQRDRVAEAGTVLALCVGSLGKMARDIVLLTQTEVAEASEAGRPGKGGSSTMPHKQNPVGCAVILAAAERVPGLAATLLHAMTQEHERGLGNWHAEWETVPEVFRLTSGAMVRAVEVIRDLQVHPEAMRANLDKSNGLIFAEAVTMALAPGMGKPKAHQLLEEASRVTVSSNRHLRDVLSEMHEVQAAFDKASLGALFEAKDYLGSSEQFIESVLQRAHEADKKNTR